MFWVRLLALTVKEFRSLWQDRKIRFVLLIPPLVQVLIFAHAATFDVAHAPIAIWDEDGSEPAHDLIQRFADSSAFDPAGRFDRPEQVDAALSERRVLAVLHIGPRFSADLKAGRPARVQLLIDGRRSNTGLIVSGYAGQIVAAFNRDRLARQGIVGGPKIEVRAWYNPTLSSRYFILPGLVALLALIMTMLITALALARERELGTFEQLLVSPLRPWELILGKVMPGLAIGLGQGIGLSLVVVWLFGMPIVGNLVILGVGMVVYLLSAIGIGLAISAIARTQQQAILGVFIFMMPAVILSGFATPIANMPGWCQALTLVNPLRYMMVVIRGVFLEDIDWALAWGQIWPLAVIAAATLVFAGSLLRRRLG